MRRRGYAEIEALVLPLSPLVQKLVAYEAKADISDPNQFLKEMRKHLKGDVTQAVDARSIAGPRHLQAAALQTLLSKERGEPWIKDISLRFIAYLTLERQVSEAVKRGGIKVGQGSSIVVCVVTVDHEEVLKCLEEFVSHQNLSYSPGSISNGSMERVSWLMRFYEVGEEELRAGKDVEALEALADVLLERMAVLSLAV